MRRSAQAHVQIFEICTRPPRGRTRLEPPPQQEAGPELLLDQAVGVNGKLSKLEAALKFLRATTYLQRVTPHVGSYVRVEVHLEEE